MVSFFYRIFCPDFIQQTHLLHGKFGILHDMGLYKQPVSFKCLQIMLFFVLRLSFSQVVGFLYYRNMFFRCESILGRKSPNVSKCHFFVHFLSLPFILHSFPLMFLLYCIHLLSFCIRVLSFSLHVALIFYSCPSMFLLFAVPFILHLFPCIFLSFPFHFTFISFHVPSLCIKHTGLQKGIYSNR